MRDRPAQRRDRHFVVHALEDVEQMVHGCVRSPVHREREALLGRPPRDLVIALLVGVARRGVVVHRERDPLADSVELEVFVAEAHRQHRGEPGELLFLPARGLAVQAVRDADGHLAAPPDVEQRPVVGGDEIVAARVDDAREREPIELAEERSRALELLRVRRPRQSVEQRDDRVVVPRDRAGRRAGTVALEPRAGREIRVALDPELREAVVGHDHPAVAELHVDGIAGRGRLELGARRPAPFRELELVPAARDDEPRAGLVRASGRCDPLEGLGQRARADPVHFAREGERRADRVQVRVDQARDRGAAAEVEHAGLRARELADLRVAAE